MTKFIYFLSGGILSKEILNDAIEYYRIKLPKYEILTEISDIGFFNIYIEFQSEEITILSLKDIISPYPHVSDNCQVYFSPIFNNNDIFEMLNDLRK